MTSLASRGVNSGRSSRQQHAVSLRCYKEEHQFHALPFLLSTLLTFHPEGEERRGTDGRRQMDALWLHSDEHTKSCSVFLHSAHSLDDLCFYLTVNVIHNGQNCFSAVTL